MKSYTDHMPKHDLKIYGIATVGVKGQFVIPQNAREELGLGEGDKLVIVGSPSKKFLGVLRDDVFQTFLNFLHLRLEHAMGMADNLEEFDNFAKQMKPAHSATKYVSRPRKRK